MGEGLVRTFFIGLGWRDYSKGYQVTIVPPERTIQPKSLLRPLLGLYHQVTEVFRMSIGPYRKTKEALP